MISSFQQALTTTYIKNPCSTEPTALWKTFYLYNHLNNDFDIKNDEVSKLLIWNESMLHTYWDNESDTIAFNNTNDFKLMILHEKFLPNVNLDDVTHNEAYFKLQFDYTTPLSEDAPPNYYFKNVNINEELEQVSSMICNCYDDMKPTKEEITKWSKHPVFHPNLWVWIVDSSNNKYVGLGIAELDNSIHEGCLEWIQVLPEYRCKGLGKALINELLLRLKPASRFVTVSGKVDNKTNPERVYRQCGFYGDDIWHVLRKR